MRRTSKESVFEEVIDHPLLPKKSSQEVTARKKGVKVSERPFIDPLSIIEPDVPDVIPEEVTSNKLDAEWTALEAAVKGQTFNGIIEIPHTLHYLLTKLDADFNSPPSLANPAARLEWLESLGNSGVNAKRSEILKNGLSKADMSDFMDACNDQLAQYWKDDHRVQVVKMSIQLAKMLSPEKPHNAFFPSLFYMVTDVLSYFGQLVYNRLVSKCPDLRVNFSIADVSPQALELCKNWLYKVASVRELAARFYLEAALLKCYRFSCDAKGYPALVERLTLMIRGFADPVSAAYARVYLVRVTLLAFGGCNPDLVRMTARHNYEEFMSIYSRCGVNDVRLNGSLTTLQFLQLFSPPLKWLILAQFFGLDENSAGREAAIRTCFNEVDNVKHPGLVLHQLLAAAPPRLVGIELARLAHVVNSYKDSEYPFHFVLLAFLEAMQRSSEVLKAQYVAKKKTLRNVFQLCWSSNVEKVATASFSHFMKCSTIFVDLWLTHFGFDPVNDVFQVIVELASKERASSHRMDETWKDEISTMLLGIITKLDQCNFLAGVPNLLPLFDFISVDQQVRVARQALENLHFENEIVVDAVAQNILMHFSSVLSTSVNALTLTDEVKQISSCICGVIDIVSRQLGDDFEQKLEFYTECRGKFKRLDMVQVRLVHLSLSLAISTKQKATKRGNFSSRIKGFMQACIGFTFITIPTLLSRYHQLQLHLLCAQVAYQCLCMGQAEASIEAILSILQGFLQAKPDGATLSAIVQDFMPSFLSYVLVIPSFGTKADSLTMTRLTKSALSVPTELLSVSSPSDQLALGLLYVKAIRLLITASSNRDLFPYHIDGVLSNDALWYGSDDTQTEKVKQMYVDLIGLVKARLDYFSQQDLETHKNQLALHLIICLKKRTNEHHSEVNDLISTLWSYVDVAKDKKGLKLRAYAEIA